MIITPGRCTYQVFSSKSRMHQFTVAISWCDDKLISMWTRKGLDELHNLNLARTPQKEPDAWHEQWSRAMKEREMLDAACSMRQL